MSSISREIQVGPDLSFEIDLSSMGLFPEKKSEHKKRQKRTERQYSEGIEEEEPWECDEDELEEELRQIDERLSYRGHKKEKFNTERDYSPHSI